jgi:hypothetical protein
MKVYVTYFRYDRNENYSIYDVSLDKEKSIKKYDTEFLPDFLGYGPDDVSYLILKEVNLTKSEYNELVRLSKKDQDYDCEIIEFMTDIHERTGVEINYVSGDLNWDVLNFFMTSGCYDLDDLLEVDTSTLDEDELSDLCQQKLWCEDEDNLFNNVLQDYLNN